MPFRETGFEGLKVFEPRVFEDERGYFFESFNRTVFAEAGIDADFVQDNQSRSQKGTLRGLHYQLNPMAQAKLVRVLEGEVLDIAVDIRPGSETYGKVYQLMLSAENRLQLFIPRGFAHGFLTLSESAVFYYKCDNFYSKQDEGGIIYNDPQLAIDWQMDESEFIISEKDQVLPRFGEHLSNF